MAIETELIAFGDESGIQRAARMISKGDVIGIYIDGVDTMWVDGRQSRAAANIQAIKGEGRVGKPLSAILETDVLVPLIDLDRIPQPLRRIFANPEDLESRMGALVALRLPIRAEAAGGLPLYMYTHSADGTYWLQDFIPKGHPTTSRLVHELALVGVTLPAATSMNVSGMPEISDQEEALAFSRQHDIPALLFDPHPNPYVVGSFPILGVSPDGVVLHREGHFPERLFGCLLDYETIDTTKAKPTRYQISPQIRERFAGTDLRGVALREALLAFVHS